MHQTRESLQQSLDGKQKKCRCSSCSYYADEGSRTKRLRSDARANTQIAYTVLPTAPTRAKCKNIQQTILFPFKLPRIRNGMCRRRLEPKNKNEIAVHSGLRSGVEGSKSQDVCSRRAPALAAAAEEKRTLHLTWILHPKRGIVIRQARCGGIRRRLVCFGRKLSRGLSCLIYCLEIHLTRASVSRGFHHARCDDVAVLLFEPLPGRAVGNKF